MLGVGVHGVWAWKKNSRTCNTVSLFGLTLHKGDVDLESLLWLGFFLHGLSIVEETWCDNLRI